jgi:hypothetical protein
MGACGSKEAANEDLEQKKRSQAIDKKLEEDSRRLRRECKILLLGMGTSAMGMKYGAANMCPYRLWRERKVDNRQTNEDHPSEWLHAGRTGALSADHLQKPH